MRQQLFRQAHQELMAAIFFMTIILPTLPGLGSRNIAFAFFVLHLHRQGIIQWKKLLRRFLAPFGFLSLSSLALMLGDHEQVFDLFTKSLMASLMLIILSQAFQGAQWLEWAWAWKIEMMLVTLMVMSFRWIKLSERLWTAMEKGWKMRSELGNCRTSTKLLGWRLMRVYHLHQQRIIDTDLAWAARGLEPILPARLGQRPRFHWLNFAFHLAAPGFAYVCAALLAGKIS
ncbi:MAG: hypothetical protein M3Q07_25525 [Pseudobdellovibrionaceae bacterium]|nr:hypothetical protein [Pseudobdellovibrionaceae bacterium]